MHGSSRNWGQNRRMQYILYRSTDVIERTVGLYLLMLGLIGEGLRYFGVSFSRM